MMFDAPVIYNETEITFTRNLPLRESVDDYLVCVGDVIAQSIPFQTKGKIIHALTGTRPYKYLIEVELSQGGRAYVWAHDYEVE